MHLASTFQLISIRQISLFPVHMEFAFCELEEVEVVERRKMGRMCFLPRLSTSPTGQKGMENTFAL